MILKYNSISMIIPTFNKANRLRITLQYINQIMSKHKVNLIIINDGSTDNTQCVLEEFVAALPKNSFKSVKIIHTMNCGRASARNKGIEEAEDEVLFFMDDDIIPSPHIIESYLNLHNQYENVVIHGIIYDLPFLKFFSAPDKGELSPDIRTHSKTIYNLKLPLCNSFKELFEKYLEKNRKLSKMERSIAATFLNKNDKAHQWISCVGGNLSLKRKQVIQCGKFDCEFGTAWGCEDLELGYRLYLQGALFIYNEEAEGYHMTHYRKSFKEEHEVTLNYFINKYKDHDVKVLKDLFQNLF